MTIHVLMFAALASRTGVRDAALDLPAGAAVGDALTVLRGRYPGLREMQGQLAFAVNQSYVRENHVLADGDELALIPPVSGG